MFTIHRAALRLLSTPSTSIATRSRTITSFAPSPLRVQKQTSSLLFQRRWASDEAKKDDPPISKLQPTPPEEVENAIQTESASEVPSQSTQSSAPGDAEAARATEAASDVVSGGSETQAPSSFNSTPRQREPRSDGFQSRGGYRSDRPERSDRPNREDRAADGRNEPKPTVYIGNLFFDVTEDDLTKELSRFGSVQKIRLIRDARGLSKGFGYATFSSTDEAQVAVQSLNSQLFEGRRLVVAYAANEAPPQVERRPRVDRPANPPTKTLFIGNMSWDMTDKDLNNLFRGIKNVIDVRVAIDRRTGQPRGFAHADFVDTKSAMEAFKLLEGKESYGRTLKIDYSAGPSNSFRNQQRDQGAL